MFGFLSKNTDADIKQVQVTHTCNGFDIGIVEGKDGLYICNPVTGDISATDGSLDDVLAYCRSQANPLEI